MNYLDLYKQRLNKNGKNIQKRLEEGRRKNFEQFLYSSPHYVTFNYNEKIIECVFEPYKQDETQTLMYILCRADITFFSPGEIININNEDYMFYYLDERKNSGYNRWVVIKLNQNITWINEDGTTYNSKAYVYSQENNMLKNELKSRSRSATLYLENLKLDFLIMPVNKNIKINSYLTISFNGISRAERVTGFDFISTPGVMYVSMDPTITRDLTPPPEKTPSDDPNDFFWLGDFT